jgi:hypothetical protein
VKAEAPAPAPVEEEEKPEQNNGGGFGEHDALLSAYFGTVPAGYGTDRGWAPQMVSNSG